MAYTIGLTLGKYAPFHKGHQYVIETALAEMDEVLVMIYDCPETTPVPLSVRADWIRKLYPRMQVIEAWDGPPDKGETPEIMRKQEEYVLKKLAGKAVTHFYTSEFYGHHMSVALGAVNRMVDPDRKAVPISGTQIRQAPFACRDYLDPIVYRDLVTNVVFVGAPSTGKSTLARRMAQEFGTACMPEYGEEYWLKHQVNRRLTLEQLVELSQGHLEREERMLWEADNYLFTDTNPITTYMFSRYYHGTVANDLVHLAREAEHRYDLVFLCDCDIPYADTWDRSGAVMREVFQKQIIADLLARKIPFITLRGDLESRVAHVKRVLARFRKYVSLGNLVIC